MTNRLAVLVFLVAAVSTISWQSTTAQTTEKQVKESIQRVAASVICTDVQLLNSVGIDRKRCEFGISTFSSDCWNVLDKWVSDYKLTDTVEDIAKYDRITDVYILCQEAKFLKGWVKLHADDSD